MRQAAFVVGDEAGGEIAWGTACGCCGGVLHAPDEGGTAPSAAADLPSLDWDGAAEQLTRDGMSWLPTSPVGGQAAPPEPLEVTFGFLSDADASSDEYGTYRAMSDAEIASIERAFACIEAVANIDFVRIDSGGDGFLDAAGGVDIAIDAMVDTNAGLTRWKGSGGLLSSATVSIGERGLEDMNSYAFRTALHELSHALGLSHPSEYGAGRPSYGSDADYAEDSGQFTVMSYFDETETGAAYGRSYSTGLMLHDVAALQTLYGENADAYDGDTVWGFGSNTNDAGWTLDGAGHDVIAAIWDAGGHDRLDLSGYAQDQRIDLAEEAFSDVGGLTANVAIARGTLIEDAAGGAGDDTLSGNDADNVLSGGEGGDLLFGGDGNDVLYGDGAPAEWGA